MIIFWFICGSMVLLTLWFVLPTLLQSPDAKRDEAGAANLLVYKDQLRELEADLKSGLLSEAQYEQDKEELERRLLEDVGGTHNSHAPPKKLLSRKLAYTVAVAIPVAAIVFYLIVGNPKALEPGAVNPPNVGTR